MSSAEVLASVDIVALRLNPGHGLELLLIRRAQAPFAGQWALPGVLVNGRSADHSLDDAAVRACATRRGWSRPTSSRWPRSATRYATRAAGR